MVEGGPGGAGAPGTRVLAPGAGLELLAPWAAKMGTVTPPSVDVTPPLTQHGEGSGLQGG